MHYKKSEMKIKKHCAAFIVLLLSCKKYDLPKYDLPPPSTITNLPPGAYILNEGYPASLSFFSFKRNKVIYPDIYKLQNNEEIPSPASSIVTYYDNTYIISEGTSEVIIINTNNAIKTATLPLPASSPTDFIVVPNSNIGVLAHKNAGIITFIDISTFTVTSTLPTGYNHHELIFTNGKIYAGTSSNIVVVINPYNKSIVKTITLSSVGARYLATAKGMVWVLCSGVDQSTYQKGAIAGIDPSSDLVTTFKWIDSIPNYHWKNPPRKLTASLDGSYLYLIYKNVLRFQTQAPYNLDTIIWAGNRNFYSIKTDEVSGNIYLSDKKDGVSPGDLLIYTPNYQIIAISQVGVNPIDFIFRY